MKKLVVMASGRGSNFEAIAKACAAKTIPATIVGLVCNRSHAAVLDKAKHFGVDTYLVESQRFRASGKLDRAQYEEQLLETIAPLAPDYICLAGYTLILGKAFIGSFKDKIINIHPSLLPKYKGLHAPRQALEAGETHTGCTVHIVTESLDDGPILAQSEIRIDSKDTESTLIEKLLPVEHATYVSALRKLCSPGNK